jgi:hypothetical protein
MLISVPVIRALSLSGAGLSFTYTAFDVLFVLFCYSPIESGGLALSVCRTILCYISVNLLATDCRDRLLSCHRRLYLLRHPAVYHTHSSRTLRPCSCVQQVHSSLAVLLSRPTTP